MPQPGDNAEPARVTYGAIGVSDIDRSLWFYCDVLGFTLVGSTPLRGTTGGSGPRAYHLVCPGGGINLLTLGSRKTTSAWSGDDLQLGVRHVGMKVADVDGWAQHLHGLGTKFRLEPVDAVGNVRISFFEDPDGANLEIVQGYLDYSKVWAPDLVAREAETPVPAPGTPSGQMRLPRSLGEHSVDDFHVRYGLVERHERALQQPGPQATLDLVGFVTKTVAGVGRHIPLRGPVVTREGA
jgi:catechol 2,3-dioxygenase-like lactoylglutathione lyase family enzyme